MKLITFDGKTIPVTVEQARAIVDSGKTNLIEIKYKVGDINKGKVEYKTEYVNANHIAAILNDDFGTPKLPTVDELRKKYGDA